MQLYSIYTSTLTALADIIRSKTFTSEAIKPSEMINFLSRPEVSFNNYFLFENGPLEINESTYKLYSSTAIPVDVFDDIISIPVSKNMFSSAAILSIPYVHTIVNTFSSCPLLKEINLPYCTLISNAFNNCGLINLLLPRCETIGSFTFMSNSDLSYVGLPKCKSIGYSAFKDCSNLSTIYFGDNINFTASCFQNCSNLKTMILKGSAVAGLGDSAYFSETLFAKVSSTFEEPPKIEVPLSLYFAYISETNWVFYSQWFKVISDYTLSQLYTYISIYSSINIQQQELFLNAINLGREEIAMQWQIQNNNQGGDNNVTQ